jgi:hypothetical protein
MDISTMNAVIFGVPVTKALYEALQVAQGKTVGLEDEDNMPSLSSSQINALITGSLKRWDNLVIDGVALTSYPGVTPPTFDFFPPANNNPLVHICRRVPGSGTQAQMNAVFANTPCAEGVAPTSRAPGSPIFGPIVVENSGSGDVDTCLIGKQNANKWAIGVQSLENEKAEYNFVKVDGVAPTLKNVAENKYRDWVETSIQWRKESIGGPSGDVLDILKKIASDASTPDSLDALNVTLVHGFGIGAYLALNTNGHVPTYPHDDANPVTTATHAPLGVPNSCQPPVVNIKSEL